MYGIIYLSINIIIMYQNSMMRKNCCLNSVQPVCRIKMFRRVNTKYDVYIWGTKSND